MDRLAHPARARVTVAFIVAAIVATIAGCTEGATMKARPQFDGPVESLRAATAGEFEDLQVGLYNVWEEGAAIGLAGNGQSEILHLKVGEAGESQGVHVRLCAVWIHASGKGDSNPGSDASRAYYVIGRGDSAPECPGQISPDA